MKNLRAVFGKLNDLVFDVVRLDTLERSKDNLRGISLELAERACAVIDDDIESEFRRLGKMLGFRVEAIGRQEGGDGFGADEFKHTAAMLRKYSNSDRASFQAVASNNINIILAALDQQGGAEAGEDARKSEAA